MGFVRSRLDSSAASLRALGVHPDALAAWAGSRRVSWLATRADELRQLPVTRGSAGLALLVAGLEVPRALLDAGALSILERHDLVGGDVTVQARVAIVPVGEAWIVCDRLDDREGDHRVLWPDDSSYHLMKALPPARTASWLDIGCGSGFAPLARPNAAETILGTDLNPRAISYARIGATLSGIAHAQFRQADLAAGIDQRFQLVTCNAPIPGASSGPMWSATSTDFVERLFDHAGRVVAADGLVIVHAAADAIHPMVATLPGERVVVVYTPNQHPREFAVAWWRPGAEPRLALRRRALTVERPHVDNGDNGG